MKNILRMIIVASLSIVLVVTYSFGGAYALESDNTRALELSGDGSEETPYDITSAEDFIATVDMLNNGEGLDKNYILSADIELSEDAILPVGTSTDPFAGSFDGQGHKITGYRQRLTADDGNYGGIFGYATNATIKNIVMESVNINNTGSSAYAGGIVGYMRDGNLSNCKVLSGSVSSGNTAGGIAGCVYNTSSKTMADFENGAVVSGTTNAGGIVGLHNLSTTLTLKRMKNTGAVNGNIAGGIVGKGRSSTYTLINNSDNSGAITGTAFAGGIAGGGIKATDCENSGEIKAAKAAGIGSAGGNLQSSAEKCINKGHVTGSSVADGIVDDNSSECYNAGVVECTGSDGVAYGIGVNGTDCYNVGKVKSEGIACGIGKGTCAQCYNIGVINGTSSSYAIGQGTVTNCYYLENRGTGQGTSLTSEQMMDQGSFAGFNFGTWTMDGIEDYPYPELYSVEMIDINVVVDGFADGKGTAKDPYHIKTTEQFVNMGKAPDAYFVLDNDIEYVSSDFTSDGSFYNDGKYIPPVGTSADPFTGSFDGQGHKITGYRQRLTADDGNYGGIFGYATNATIKNVVMESVNITNTSSSAYVGGIVGYMKNSSLNNCKVLSGSIASGNTAGGIAGCMNNASAVTMADFENGAVISGTTNTGGIIGIHNTSSVLTAKRMKNTGAVNGKVAGGIIGKGYSGSELINNSSNSGPITGTTCAGGITGGGVRATNCENTGEIKAEKAAGIGSSAGGSTIAEKCSNKGHVVASSVADGIVDLTATECYNAGTVECTGSDGFAYGIGVNGTDCYNVGKVKSEGIACGIGKGTCAQCYNIGVINGTSSSYAIGQGTVTNCYYLENRGTGQGTSLTSEQMMDQGSFAGFSFVNLWTMDGIRTYPFPKLDSVEMVDIEIESIADIQNAIIINDVIGELPSEITLDDKDAIAKARELCDEYASRFSEEALGNIPDYQKLLDAEATLEHLIKEAHNLQNAIITGIKDAVYTGKAIKPTPTVTIAGYILQPVTDYSIEYSDNVNAGTATVIITGAGDYTESVTRTFTIKAKKVKPIVKLAKKKYVYNGKVRKPKATVIVSGKTLTSTDYSLTYSKGCKKVGKYIATVKLKGNYAGSKKVSYVIVPKGTVLKKLIPAKKEITVKWRAQKKEATGYQIQCSIKKNFKSGTKTVFVKKNKLTYKKITKLKAKKKYYVRIRTYKNVSGSKYYSDWSKSMAVKTK